VVVAIPPDLFDSALRDPGQVSELDPRALFPHASGLQFLQLALDQAFGVLRIGGAQWSQSDGGATFWDDHEISPHQRVAFHRHVINIRKRNRYRSSLANDFRVDELDTVFVDSQTLITY
jgi:hypothetical protein